MAENMLVKCAVCGHEFGVPEPVPETFTCPRCYTVLTLAEGGQYVAVAVATSVGVAVTSAIATAFIMGRFPPRKERFWDDVRDIFASVVVSGFFGIIAYLAMKPKG